MPEPRPAPGRRRRRGILSVALALVAVVALLAAVFVPTHQSTYRLSLAAGTTGTQSFTVPQAAYVNVQFGHVGDGAMTYGMSGPGGGMMFDHTNRMSRGDSYSFGTWGGSYRCWVSVAPGFGGMTPVWVNVSWGML